MSDSCLMSKTFNKGVSYTKHKGLVYNKTVMSNISKIYKNV